MDYEKKYREALERAKNLYENANGRILKNWIEQVFPELKESEDERIRTTLIKFFSKGAENNSFTNGISDKDILTWLENQKTSEEALQYLRENHSPSKVSDFQAAMNIAVAKAYDKGYNDGLEKQVKKEYALKSSNKEDVLKLMEYITKLGKNYDLNLPNRSYDIYAVAKDILYWLEKQGETDSSIKWHDVSEKPEKNREVLCEWVGSNNCIWHDITFYNPTNEAFWNHGRQVDYVTRWCYIDNLVKQGEQKETLCDKCRKAQPSHSCQDITASGRCYLEHEK